MNSQKSPIFALEMEQGPINTRCFGDFKERKIWCYDMDASQAFEPNTIHRSVTCYIYGIVLQGTITIRYNGKLLTAGPGEMVMNMPGLNLDTEAATPGYRSIALVVMADFNDENLSMRKVLQNAWFPIMYLRTPILPLTEIQSARLQQTMRLIQERQREVHTYSADVLQTLHSLFLLDLMDVQNGLTDLKRSPQRYDTFFISFMALLPAHFREEHELAFYADKLHISTTYLSRIVRSITGRTAGDFIARMLLREACWALRSTDVPICQIASYLNFGDQAAFTKFFRRWMQASPTAFRAKYRL